MSVFTPLQRAELEVFLADYGLGRLHDFQGIAAGTENSNFFVSLESGEYVLTLIERGAHGDLPFFVELLDRLHDAGLPVPNALPTRNGEKLRELSGRPALLQPRLPGAHVQQPNAQHCREIGHCLARLHLATRDHPLQRRSDRGLAWMRGEGPKLMPGLPAAQAELLGRALDEIAALGPRILALPQANLHADLFRDNALFEGAHLTGIIDFYNACCGPMLYDLAIAINDWCSRADGQLDESLAHALLGAYAARRRFVVAEADLWPPLLRIACLRFWLSRLIAAQAFDGQDVLIKDPTEFSRQLAARQQVGLALPIAL
jgi:homoserine kinase type II